MNFKSFKDAISQQFETMKQYTLFRMDISKEDMWDTYLSSFPEGSNPMFRERTEHDCQACKSFIRSTGNIVSIYNGQIISIWDAQVGDENYQAVADAMSILVKSVPIHNLFLTTKKKAGININYQDAADGILTWEHFHVSLPSTCVLPGDDIGTKSGEYRATFDVMFRGATDISMEAIDTVLELIDQNSLYRGEENRFAVAGFKELKDAFDEAEDKDMFCWDFMMDVQPSIARIRNTSIGTLLVNLSEGMEMDVAVGKFEAMVAPTNYKRPTALITPTMIKKAQALVEKLGFTTALQRRYAVIDDITINNVLYADRTAKKEMGVFDELIAAQPVNVLAFDKVEEISIETFLRNIMPTATSLELMFENKHAGNLMSLVAPEDPTSKTMFNWHNNFSWAYTGEVADSMKERVKAAGGKVNGFLRFSLQWNEKITDPSIDLDAHCHAPEGHIYFSNMHGKLDVDNQYPGSKVAVENITWSCKQDIRTGEYFFRVHNYTGGTCTGGFSVEIEIDGVIHSYSYNKPIHQHTYVDIAKINYDGNDFQVNHLLNSSTSSKEIWGISTQQFHKVSIIMNSPNHWDDKVNGNKHYFFMLEDCLNKDAARGFFNEFLTPELREHRKVFEVLGSKMKAAASNKQLSGLGFSSTQRNSVLCRVEGSFSRIIKLIF